MGQDPNPTRGIQAEMPVGVSAVVIGVCALGVSLYETLLMREQPRAAVLPILELGWFFYLAPETQGTDGWRLSFSAENVGIGPRVLDYVVTVDGEPQATWGEAIRTLQREYTPAAESSSHSEQTHHICGLKNAVFEKKVHEKYEKDSNKRQDNP